MVAVDTDAILRELSAFRAEVREEVATAFRSLEQSNQRIMQEVQLLRASSQQHSGNRGRNGWVSEPMRRDSGNPCAGAGIADGLWCRPGPVAEGLCSDDLDAEESSSEPVAEGSYRRIITTGPESPRIKQLASDSELPITPTGPRTAVFGPRSTRALLPRGSEESSYSARNSSDQLGALYLKAEKSRRMAAMASASQTPAKRGSIIVAEEYSEDEDEDLEVLEVEAHHGIWQRIQKSMKRPVHPNGTFRIRWDLFLLVLLLYVCITAPVIVSFEVKLMPDNVLWWVEMFVTVMFVIDIVFNFNTAYFGVQDQLVTNRLHIAANYATTWLVVDAIAVFPFELIAGGNGDTEASSLVKGLRLGKFTKLLRVLRVVKLLRILKILKLSPMLKELTAISGQNVLRFVSVVGSALLLLHLMACSFFMAANLYHQDVLEKIGPINADNMEEKMEQAWESTWVGMAGLANETSVNRYITALYWSVYTLTTVGYGDVSAQNIYEKLVAMAGMMVGVTVFAYFMGNTASFIAAVNSQEAAISQRVMQMKEFLRARHVPNTLSNKISHFYSMAARKQVLDDNEIVKGLSSQLKTELLMFLYRKTLQKVPFFEGQNPQFITALVSKLELEYYADGDMVVAEHDVGSEMYFVVNGMLEARKYNNVPGEPKSAAVSRASSTRSQKPGLMRRITLTVAEQTNYIREKLQPENDRVDYKSPFMKMRPNGDDYEVVDVLQEGDHFGETAIILGHPRSSTVIAMEFSELYSLARPDLLEVYQQWPDLYRQFQDFVDQINMEQTMGSPSFNSRYEDTDFQPSAEASKGSFGMNQQEEDSSPGLIDSVIPEGSDRVRFHVPGQVDNGDLETGSGGRLSRLRENSKTSTIANEVVATIQHSVRMRGGSVDLEIEDCEPLDNRGSIRERNSIDGVDLSGISSNSANPMMGSTGRLSLKGQVPTVSRRMKNTAMRVVQMQEEGMHKDNPVLRLLDNGHDLKALKHQTTKTREGK